MMVWNRNQFFALESESNYPLRERILGPWFSMKSLIYKLNQCFCLKVRKICLHELNFAYRFHKMGVTNGASAETCKDE